MALFDFWDCLEVFWYLFGFLDFFFPNSGCVQTLALFEFRICFRSSLVFFFWFLNFLFRILGLYKLRLCLTFEIVQKFFGICLGFWIFFRNLGLYKLWLCSNSGFAPKCLWCLLRFFNILNSRFVQTLAPFRICWCLFWFLNFFRILDLYWLCSTSEFLPELRWCLFGFLNLFLVFGFFCDNFFHDILTCVIRTWNRTRIVSIWMILWRIEIIF